MERDYIVRLTPDECEQVQRVLARQAKRDDKDVETERLKNDILKNLVTRRSGACRKAARQFRRQLPG